MPASNDTTLAISALVLHDGDEHHEAVHASSDIGQDRLPGGQGPIRSRVDSGHAEGHSAQVLGRDQGR